MSDFRSEFESLLSEKQPKIYLLDDRVDRLAMHEINLATYLGAKVVLVQTPEELERLLREDEPPQLVVCKGNFKGLNTVKRAKSVIRARGILVPVIALGGDVPGPDDDYYRVSHEE